ncbi:MAG: NUDIX domain-containing protein [Roseovarius sp.]
MTPVFLYGAMAQSAARDRVLGQGAAQTVNAQVAGHALPDVPGPLALASVGGGPLEGIILSELIQDQLARLEFAMRVCGGELTKVSARAETGQVSAQMWVASPEHPSRHDRFPVEAIEQAALTEIMGYFPHFDAKTIAQRRAMILARAAAQVAARTPKPADLRSRRTHDQITQHSQSAQHQGFFRTHTYQIEHPRFDGTTSPVLTREAFVATDAAIVLPYDAKRDRVLLVEQFRMGPYGRGDALPWMLEPVAGRVDAGESPETCARRECLEEAGLELQELIKISSHYCSPGCSTEYFHVYLGLCDLPDDRPAHGGLETEHEDIALHVISYDAAMALLETGEANNGPLVLSLLWLSKTRERLRASA